MCKRKAYHTDTVQVYTEEHNNLTARIPSSKGLCFGLQAARHHPHMQAALWRYCDGVSQLQRLLSKQQTAVKAPLNAFICMTGCVRPVC